MELSSSGSCNLRPAAPVRPVRPPDPAGESPNSQDPPPIVYDCIYLHQIRKSCPTLGFYFIFIFEKIKPLSMYLYKPCPSVWNETFLPVFPPLGGERPEIDLWWETASRPPAAERSVQAGLFCSQRGWDIGIRYYMDFCLVKACNHQSARNK